MGINFDFDPEKGIQLYSSLSAQVPDGFVDEDSSMLGGNFDYQLS